MKVLSKRKTNSIHTQSDYKYNIDLLQVSPIISQNSNAAEPK